MATSRGQEFADLPESVRRSLNSFIEAVVIVDPFEYQRDANDQLDRSKNMRTLCFGQHGRGLVTFLIYSPDELVLVTKIIWFDLD